MPWLVREDEPAAEPPLLLVHVPRCGGTSLVKHFDVEGKSRRRAKNPFNRLGLLYFFYRYRLMETANFPLMSFENLWAFFVLTTATVVFFADSSMHIPACSDDAWCPAPLSVSFWTMGVFTFIMSTFVMTAAFMARNETIRKTMILVFGKVMCDFAATTVYIHGVSYKGWLMHLTAEKMLRHRLVLREDLDQHAFAIVRNPYSRLVSIFRYNRRGGCESFKRFLREWRHKLVAYEETGTTDEWDIYCQVLPMFAFTHWSGVPLVPHIVRQEDLKALKSQKHAAGADAPLPGAAQLPEKILRALRDMPHSNKRVVAGEPWESLYDQEAMDLVLDMYAADFALFGYSTHLDKRPDLAPKRSLAELQRGVSGRASAAAAVSEVARHSDKGAETCRESTGETSLQPAAYVSVV